MKFLPKVNAIFSYLRSVEELLSLDALNCVLKCIPVLSFFFFLCGMNKTLREIDLLIISTFFSSLREKLIEGNFMSYHSYWFKKG